MLESRVDPPGAFSLARYPSPLWVDTTHTYSTHGTAGGGVRIAVFFGGSSFCSSVTFLVCLFVCLFASLVLVVLVLLLFPSFYDKFVKSITFPTF